MSNLKIMKSSILIHVSEEGSSVIRVIEPNSPDNSRLPILPEDVRDVLVARFRNSLRSTSSTLTFKVVEHLPNNTVYDIVPVSDELTYFEERILELSPFGQFSDGPNAKAIRAFFDDLRNVSLGDHNPSALAKFNEWNPTGLNGMGKPE